MSFLGYVRDAYRLDAATVQRYLLTLKRTPQKVIRGLPSDQVKTLLRHLGDRTLEDARNKAIVLILINCGLGRFTISCTVKEN